MPVHYPSDEANGTNGTTPISTNNVTQRYIQKDVVLDNSAVATRVANKEFRYPSSEAWGGDNLFSATGTTDTLGDFALACNRLMGQIWSLSALVPGIYNTMSSGAAPNTASNPSNTTAADKKYITQAFSLKMNDAKRKIGRLEYVLQRLSENIDGAIGASGTQAPAGTTSRYPSGDARGY